MVWRKEVVDGYEVWSGETEAMQISIVPDLGSKVISLRNRRTGREWLTQPKGKHGNGGYASSFSESDGSGWDEMFPTINPCRYPAFPWVGTELPDHGEVWSIPWEANVEQSALHCRVNGIRMPYQLHKSYSFTQENCLRIDYSVRNLSPFPFSFLWAAHPLFQIEEGMEIIVPEGISEMIVSYSENGRLGQTGDIRKWPQPFGNEQDLRLNVVGRHDEGSAEKYYFIGELPEGKASLYDPRTKDGLHLNFPKEKVPYLSIWANYGGYQGQYHLAIEPTTGLLDDLSYAMSQDAVVSVPAGDVYTWHIEVCLK